MTVTSLTNNTPPGAKLHTKFVACEEKKIIAHCTFSLHIFIAHCTFSLQIVALKNEIGRNKCKILAQKKYKSTTATNPTELQASRKVAKPGEACQEALLKLCVKKIFIEMA